MHASCTARFRNRPRPLLALAVALSALCAAPQVHADQSHKELQAKRKALKEVKRHIQHVQKAIEAAQHRQGRLTRELRRAETRIGQLTRSEHELDEKIADQKHQIARTQDKSRQLRAALEKSRQALADQARAAYLMGHQSQIKLLLSQQNPALVERLMTYYDYIMRARAHAIAQIQDRAQALQKTQAQLKSQLGSLQQLDEQKKQTLTHLHEEHSNRRQALEGINRHLKSQSQKLAALKHDQSHLEDLIGSLSQALSHMPQPAGQKQPFRDLKGKLPWPLHGHVLAHYGQGKSGGEMDWQGLWVSAPQGKPIHSVAYGRVVYVGWMPSYGLLLILDHGGGYYTLYAHDESVTKQVGQAVKPGEEIATAGDTGGHQHSGVYFEIRKGKTPLDPAHWLRH